MKDTTNQKMRKILTAVFDKIPKNLICHFRKFEIFLENLVKSFFGPIFSPNFMLKIRKTLTTDSEKKMLLMNRRTNNNELIGSFSSWVQFEMILHILLRFVYISLQSDSYFSIFRNALWIPVDGCSQRSWRILFTAYFLIVTDKRLEHKLR